MSDDVIGSPTLRVKVDPKQVASGLDAAVSSYKQGLAKVNAAMQQAQAAQARVTKQIQGEIDRINATQATSKLQILSQAIDQMGGKAKLSDDQVKRLTADVERLAAAGGKVPKSLAAFQTQAGPGAGAAVAASLQGTLASSGPAGAVGAGISALGPAGVAAAAGIGGVAIAFGLAEKAASAFLDRADQLNNISGKTGLGTEFLQKLDAAGAEVGVTLEASSGAVFKLEKTIGEAVQGNKQAADSFADIGLSIDELKGKSPEEQFRLVAGALATIHDQSQFVAAGTSVMGKGFSEVAALIRSDFTSAMDRAVVLSDDLVQKGAAIGAAFTRLGGAADIVKVSLGAALLEALSGSGDAATAIDKITDAVKGLAVVVTNPAFVSALRVVGSVSGVTAITGGLSQLGSRQPPAAPTPKDEQQAARTLVAQDAARMNAELLAALKAGKEGERKAQQQQDDFTSKSIGLEREYAEAVAGTTQGLEAEIGKIQANAAAKSAQIQADDKLSAAQKSYLEGLVNEVAAAQESQASFQALQQSVSDTAKEYQAAAKLKVEADAASLTPLESAIVKIEGKRKAEIADALAVEDTARKQGRLTASLIDGVTAHIHAANAAADNGIAEAQFADAVKRGNAQYDEFVRGVIEGDAAMVRADKLAQEEKAQFFSDLSDDLNAANDLLQAFGASATSLLSKVFAAGSKGADIFARSIQSGQLSFVDLAGAAADAFKGKSILGGAVEGGTVGALFGPEGAAIGAGIGALIGGIGKLFGGESPEAKAAKTAASVFGHEVSQSLAKAIADDAQRVGDRVAATLLHISDAIDEAGGVKGFGFDNATKAAHDLFSEIETGKLSVAEAGSEFDKVFGQLLPEAIDKTTGIAKQSFLDLIKLDQQFGTNSQQVQQFIQGQTSKVVSGLQAVAKGAEVSAKSAPGLGAAFVAAFNQLVQAGATPREAFAQLGDSLAQMQKKFKDAGVDGGAAFAQLAAESGLLKDEVAGPLYDAIAGAGDAMAGLANTNALTPEAFAGLSSTISETFAKLEEQGKGGSTGLAIIAPQLQELYELEQRFGFTADEATQKLIDQGKAAGLVGEEHKSVQEQTLDVLKSIAEVLGAKIPEAAKKGAAGVKDAFKGLQVDTVTIPYSYEPAPGSGLPGGAPGLPPNIPKHAGGGYFTTPHIAAIAEAGVPEFVVQAPVMRGFGEVAAAIGARAAAESRGGAGGPSFPPPVVFNVNVAVDASGAGSPQEVGEAVAAALREELAPLVEEFDRRIERAA